MILEWFLVSGVQLQSFAFLPVPLGLAGGVVLVVLLVRWVGVLSCGPIRYAEGAFEIFLC